MVVLLQIFQIQLEDHLHHLFLVKLYLLQVSTILLPRGHSGVSDRGMNISGGPAFTSGMDAIGSSIHGLASNMGTSVSHSSVHGMSASPMLGNMGPRSNIGRIISSGGLYVPGIASHMNLSGNVGSGNLN